MLATIDQPYQDDFIFGIVQTQQKLGEKEFQTIKDLLVEKHAGIFYEQWGFHTLGYRYYALFLNREKILAEIPPFEQWVFKKTLERFNPRLSDHGTPLNWDTLIKTIPTHYQTAAIRGVGKLIGAEMLFDPMATLDYPLDSRFGKRITTPALSDAFYEGIGAGFVETLTRFWRTLSLPDNPDDPRYTGMLDMEWERAQNLIRTFPPQYSSLIARGFEEELRKKHPGAGIRAYIQRRGDIHKIIN
jgi:hypothetical protein